MKNHFCLGTSFDLTSLPCFVARLTRKAVHALVARVTLHINRHINFDTSKYFDCGQSFLLWELLPLSNLNSRHWQCPPTEPLSLHRNKTEFVFCFGRIVKLTSVCFFTATMAKLYLLTAWDCQWKFGNSELWQQGFKCDTVMSRKKTHFIPKRADGFTGRQQQDKVRVRQEQTQAIR